MKKQNTDEVRNMFPLLEEEQQQQEEQEKTKTVDPIVRLEWLKKVSVATSEEFDVVLKRAEPQTFHETHAVILKMGNKKALKLWLALEKQACAKKLWTKRESLKLLRVRYGVSIEKNKGVYDIRFNHQDGWEMKVSDAELDTKLAENAFPLHEKSRLQGGQPISDDVIKAAEAVLFRAKGREEAGEPPSKQQKK